MSTLHTVVERTVKPSAWVIVALCLYLLLEAVVDVRRKEDARAHPHRAMIIAVTLTLGAVAAVLYERGY